MIRARYFKKKGWVFVVFVGQDTLYKLKMLQMNFLLKQLNPFSFQVLATVSYSCEVFSYTVFIVRDVSVLLFLC